jgi:hypothetical protein
MGGVGCRGGGGRGRVRGGRSGRRLGKARGGWGGKVKGSSGAEKRPRTTFMACSILLGSCCGLPAKTWIRAASGDSLGAAGILTKWSGSEGKERTLKTIP